MKPAETKRLYERACGAKRIVPQEDEGRAWHRVLRDFEARDVEAALDAWWADTTTGKDGRPRGAWLPTPAELKPLAEAAERKRKVADAEPKDYVSWRCACGYGMGGFVSRDDRRERKCPACGKPMPELSRDAAQAVLA